MSDIPDNEVEIIFHSRKTFLFHEGRPWVKKSGSFDVPMGSFDGAEICELVGLYLLFRITNRTAPIFNKNDVPSDNSV